MSTDRFSGKVGDRKSHALPTKKTWQFTLNWLQTVLKQLLRRFWMLERGHVVVGSSKSQPYGLILKGNLTKRWHLFPHTRPCFEINACVAPFRLNMRVIELHVIALVWIVGHLCLSSWLVLSYLDFVFINSSASKPKPSQPNVFSTSRKQLQQYGVCVMPAKGLPSRRKNNKGENGTQQSERHIMF